MFTIAPLLHTTDMILPKLALFSGYGMLLYILYNFNPKFYLAKRDRVYLSGFLAITAYEHWFQYQWGLAERYQFLPLMLTSCYGAFGILSFYIRYEMYMSCPFSFKYEEESLKNDRLALHPCMMADIERKKQKAKMEKAAAEKAAAAEDMVNKTKPKKKKQQKNKDA